MTFAQLERCPLDKISVWLSVLCLIALGACHHPSNTREPSDREEPAKKKESSSEDAEPKVAEECLEVPLAEPERKTAVLFVASLDREPIKRAFSRHQPRFQCCYEEMVERLSSEPPTGAVTLDMQIEHGRAEDVDIREQPEDFDETFGTCMEGVAANLTVPEWLEAGGERREESEAGAEASRPDYKPGTRPIPGGGEEDSRAEIEVVQVSYPLKFE